MSADKISIIIPVYNVEPYIRKCLDSVMTQTHTNLEILLIDDGSPDNCGMICDEYAARDTRFKVFHRENGGLSSALNVGLDNVTGDYIGFVDSDDWIEPDTYEVLYKAIKASGAQISVGSYFKADGSGSVPVKNRKQIPNGLINKKDMLLYPLKRDDYIGFCGYVWNKLWSADTIRESKLKFEDEIKYGMDIVFYMTIVLKQRCTGVYTDKPLNHYLQRETAISKSKAYNIKYDILTVYKRVEELMNGYGYSALSYWARGFYCYHASTIAQIAIANSDEEILRKMQAEIREHLDDYIKTNQGFPEKFEMMYKLLEEVK